MMIEQKNRHSQLFKTIAMGVVCLFWVNTFFQNTSYAGSIYESLATNSMADGIGENEVNRAKVKMCLDLMDRKGPRPRTEIETVHSVYQEGLLGDILDKYEEYMSRQASLQENKVEVRKLAAYYRDEFQQSSKDFAGGDYRFRFRLPQQLVDELRVQRAQETDRIVIVDIGCATGHTARWTLHQDQRFRLLGLEKEPALVSRAIEDAEEEGLNLLDTESLPDISQALRASEVPTVAYKVADVTAGLPLQNNSVDAIILHRMISTIIDLSERNRLIDEIRRVLTPGGWVSFVDDLHVGANEPEAEWYQVRYTVSARVIQQLVDAGLLPNIYKDLLNNPNFYLLLSLRSPGGLRIDDAAFHGREDDLVGGIKQGHIRIRGVGVHETEQHITNNFGERGLKVRDKWHVSMPETGSRKGHNTIMTGLLFQKGDVAGSPTQPAEYFASEEHLNHIRTAHQTAETSRVIEGRTQLIVPQEYMNELRPGIVSKSTDVVVVSRQKAKEIATATDDTVKNKVILLKTEDIDDNIRKHAKWKVLELDNYHPLHLAAVIELGRSVLAGHRESIDEFYFLLRNENITDAIRRALMAPQPGVISLILQGIPVERIPNMDELRGKYADFIEKFA